jgi:hypothetical protein
MNTKFCARRPTLVFQFLVVVLLSLLDVSTATALFPYSCSALIADGITASGTYTIWPTGPTGLNHTVYCDMVTDGGGWMLTWAYKHVAGESVALVPGTIPTDPKTGYSHVDAEVMYSTVDEISEVRFYCETTQHNRVIHFKTSNTFQATMALTGSSSGNLASYWTSGYTALANHTGYLPASTTDVISSTTIGFSYFPFYTLGTYHWSISGPTNRWGCDDPDAGSSYDTRHLIYVKMVEGRPTTTPTPSPTVLPSLAPTPSPTVLPSPVPTISHPPSPIPSLLPTISSQPTPMPTITPAPTQQPYPYSCNALASEGETASGTYTIYPTGPLGTSYTVYCDMVTDGGGWMLTWAYNHWRSSSSIGSRNYSYRSKNWLFSCGRG